VQQAFSAVARLLVPAKLHHPVGRQAVDFGEAEARLAAMEAKIPPRDSDP
jgi:hypothetical protein